MPFFKKKQDKQKAAASGKDSAAVKRTPSTRSNPQSPDSVNGDIGIPSSAHKPPGLINSLVLSEDVLTENDPDQGGVFDKATEKTSRLSKTLQEVLHDKDALHCFLSYMETHQAQRFIRFWLDANSFRASTLTRLRTHSVGNNSAAKRRSETRSEGSDGGEAVGEQTQSLSGNGMSGVTAGSNLSEESKQTLAHTEGEHFFQKETSCDRLKPSADVSSNKDFSVVGSAESLSPNNQGGQETECNRNGFNKSKADKPSSLPLMQVNVQVEVTSPSSEDVSEISNFDGMELNSPCGLDRSLSSLQDSGIATPSEGDSVMTPGSQLEVTGHSESVDALIGVRACSSIEGVKSEDKRIVEEGVGNTDNGDNEGVLPEGDGSASGKAGAVMSAPEGEGTNGAARSTAGKTDRAASMEEMREKLKKSIERDAVSIFTKYIAQDAPEPIGVDDALRAETIHKICGEDKQVDPSCFVACQDFVVKYMEREYHKPFTDSEFYCKHQVHVLTGSQVYLADILYNEHALCYFMEFMEQEGCQPLMQFWMGADNFQQQLQHQGEGYDGLQAQTDAMVLYDRFFSLQASMPLGFGDKIRFEVESNICREGGPLPDCFSKPQDIVVHTMEKVYFHRYLCSEMYYRYLSDLVNTVQMAQDLPLKRHRRQASDASSEHSVGSHSLGAESISTRNTLLAAGSRGARKGGASPAPTPSPSSLSGVVGRIEEHLSAMDTESLNPEDLWKQPNKVPLRLGSVNSLGQFVSEFEQDPDGGKKKGGGFFKKNKVKEKEQEEMAMQVAQMILNDVANMTQMGDACAQPDAAFTTSKNNSNATASALSSPLSFSPSLSSSSPFEPPPS